MSLCGPSNALNKLSQHSQVDRSLQQDHTNTRFNHNESFRQVGQNHQLDLEFQQQVHQQQQSQQGFNPIFANAFNKPKQHPAQQQQQQRPIAKSSWAADFSSSMNQINQQMNHVQHQQGWNNEFKTFQQQQAPPSIATPRSFTNLQQLSNLNMTTATIAPPTFMTEHQELHHRHHQKQSVSFDLELESEFSKLEQDLNKTSLNEPSFKTSNKDFANAALQVVSAMNSQQSSKFQQSKFLSLMNMVASGKVELNEDESKLIDESGQEINEQINNGLPDPLEGIKVGELETPFQSANLIAENHGEKYTWDEMYDDYKHDDTSF